MLNPSYYSGNLHHWVARNWRPRRRLGWPSLLLLSLAPHRACQQEKKAADCDASVHFTLLSLYSKSKTSAIAK